VEKQMADSKVTVCGIGNSGIKIISRLSALKEASWLSVSAIDTDESSLERCATDNKFTAATEWRNGKGCEFIMLNGQRALARERSKINDMLKDSSLLIVTGGLGGGTATGGAPIIASVAKHAKIPSIFIMTMPFALEGHSKRRVAEEGVRELLPVADVLLCLPNDLLFSSLPTDTPVAAAFEQADMEVARAIIGVSELIRCNNLISADFSDLRAVLHEKKSSCSIGVGSASIDDGLNRCHIALEKMLCSPFLGGVSQMNTADALFITLTGGADLQIGEMKKALEAAERLAGKKTRLIAGTNTDPAYEGMVQLTAITVHYDKSAPLATPADSGKDFIFPKSQFKGREAKEKKAAELKQGELPLQSVSKGIFINTTPSIYEGKDLDIPTFQREMIIIDKGN